MSLQIPHRHPGPCAACGHEIHLKPSTLIYGNPELLCDVCTRLVSLGLIPDPRESSIVVGDTVLDEQEAKHGGH